MTTSVRRVAYSRNPDTEARWCYVNYQRKHHRYPVDTVAAVSVLGLEQHRIYARVLDISEGGLKLLGDVPMVLGETIRVDIETEVLVGVVRNCDCDSSKYTTGIELINSIERGMLQSLMDEWSVEV